MKRISLVFAIVLTAALILATVVSALVNNGGFETGTFGGWTKTAFINNGFSLAPGSGGSDLSAIVGGPATSPLSLSDPNSSGAIKYPGYGHYTARVNSQASYSGGGFGKNGNTITQNVAAFLDPADNLAHIRFTYAAIMVNPVSSPHTAEQKPYFRVRAINTSNANDVLYDFASYVNEPGKNWQNGPVFSGSDTWQYLDWNYIDLASSPAHPVNAGDIITLDVTAAGCSLGGHPGYVYIDEITDGDIAGPSIKAIAPAAAPSGSSIIYTYDYKNGSGVSVDPTITSTQPAGVTFTTVSDPVHCSLSGGTVTCNFTGLAAGASSSLTITGTVTAANGSQIAHGNYDISATGFPTISGQTVFTSVTTADTTTAVGSSANPSKFGQSVTYTATVTPVGSGMGTPTGTVQFVLDGSSFGAPISLNGSGLAQISTSSLGVASHTVSAQYGGSGTFNPSSGSLSGGQTVNKSDASVTINSSSNPSVSGQPVSVTATVAAVAPGAGTPTGTVTFSVDGSPVCSNVAVAGGNASCNLPTLSVGSHTVTATYSGDGNFNGGNGTLSGGQTVNKANSSVSLNSSVNPAVSGEPLVITASVGAVAPGTGTPTGTVTFFVDGNPVCTSVPVSAGQATCNVEGLGVGTHTITAQYSGDSGFNDGSGTLTGGENVNKADSSLTLGSAPNPSVSGQSVTITATVAATAPGTGTPTGTVTFNVDGGTACSNAGLAGGQATCSVSSIAVGSHTVTAQYSGDTRFNGSSGTLAGGQTVNKADSNISLNSSANPSVSGQPVSVTATVSAVAPGTGTPTGTVTFFVDGSPVCSNVNLTGGHASCSLLSLGVGSHTITAQYSGDGSFNGGNGTLAGGQIVNKSDSAVTLASSASPAVYGQTVAVTATVGPIAPGSGTPTGNVTIFVDGNPVCPNVPLSGGQASCDLPVLGIGNHVVTAQYNGDANFNVSNGSLAGGETINKADSALALGSSANPSVSGQSVTITASASAVAPGSGTPSGSVTFFVDGSPVCTNATLLGGQATCSTSSMSVGNHTITAQYGGDTNFNSSSGSLAASQTVNKADSSVALNSSVNPSVTGQSTTVTATVTAVAPGSGTPTGSVSFFVDSNPTCSSVALVGGQATCSVALSAGSHTVTALYGGNGNFNAANGTLAGGQTVNAAESSVGLTVSNNPIVAGQPVTLTASVAAVAPGAGTPIGTVSFFMDGIAVCTNVSLSSGQASCTFSSNLAGNHVITAQYNGDANFNGSSGSLAGGLNINKANTTAAVVASQNPITFGQSDNFTATITPVAPGSGTPTGLVSFEVDGTLYCQNTPLSAGQATCMVPNLLAGNRVIGVHYYGDANYNPSAAYMTGGFLIVNKAGTGVSITNAAALGSMTSVGQAYAVTWSISVIAPGAGTPTGNVTVSDGTDTCFANVSSGTCLLTSTTSGAKTITATYEGDLNFSSSTSGGVPHSVGVVIAGNIRQFVAGGVPVALPNAQVTLSGSAGDAQTTDASGNYAFVDLPAGGTYVVTPSGFGNTYEPLSHSYSNVTTNITNGSFTGFDPNKFPRNLKVVNGYAMPGQPVTMGVNLVSMGNEASISFSLSYDFNPLHGPVVHCGSGAPGCAITADNSTQGKLGIVVIPATPLIAGERQIVTITFDTFATNLWNTPITVTDDPTAKSILDANGDPLASAYTDGDLVFAQGLEGDVATRSTGDALLLSNDVVTVRQFVVGNWTPSRLMNEFQRADTAPLPTKGDGQLDATDVIQARRFIVGFDGTRSSGGPFNQSAQVIARPSNLANTARALHIASAEAAPGRQIAIPLDLDSQGDEDGMSFTLNFDPLKLSNPNVTLGGDVSSDTILTVNSSEADRGRVRILLDSPDTIALSSLSRLLTVTFDIVPDAAGGPTSVSFGNDPTPSSVSNAKAEVLPTNYINGVITISGPALPSVEISGRVFSPDGRGLRNAEVDLVDSNGVVRTAVTSSFGYYGFGNVERGSSYTIGVSSKRFRFTSRNIQVMDNLSDVDITAEP